MTPAVEASDRLGRNCPPPDMMVPCSRITGIVTASDCQDFGSNFLRRRLKAGVSDVRSLVM